MNDDPYTPSKYAKYICWEEPVPVGSNLIIKNGYVVNEEAISYNCCVQAGMGSAFGGQWKPSPNKPMDQRFLGQPGEIKITYNNKGERFETKIGDDGQEIKERHNTDHNRPDKHSNPHDHILTSQRDIQTRGLLLTIPMEYRNLNLSVVWDWDHHHDCSYHKGNKKV